MSKQNASSDRHSLWRRIAATALSAVCAVTLLSPQALTVQAANPAPDTITGSYKLTDSLTAADQEGSQQKNYTYAKDSSTDAYLYQTAEWTNKEAGKAQVKVISKTPAEGGKADSCVYVYMALDTPRAGKEMSRKKINELKEHYKTVDVVVPDGHTWNSIKIFTDVANGDVVDKVIWGEKAYTDWQYAGLVKYLMGDSPNATTQTRFPDAIYVFGYFFLGFTAGTGYTNIDDYYTYPLWFLKTGTPINMSVFPILQKYQSEGRYFYLKLKSDAVVVQWGTELYGDTKATYLQAQNTSLSVFDPLRYYNPNTFSTTLGGDPVYAVKKTDPCDPNKTWINWHPTPTVTIKSFYSDNSYLVDDPLPLYGTNSSSLKLSSTAADAFTIESCSAKQGDQDLAVTISDDKKSCSVDAAETYDGSEIVMTINLALSSENVFGWKDTMASCTANGYDADMDKRYALTSDSTKLCHVFSSYDIANNNKNNLNDDDPVLLGDLNMDGKLTAKDAMLLVKYIRNQKTLTQDIKLISDINGDGKVTVKDATLPLFPDCFSIHWTTFTLLYYQAQIADFYRLFAAEGLYSF